MGIVIVSVLVCNRMLVPMQIDEMLFCTRFWFVKCCNNIDAFCANMMFSALKLSSCGH